MLVNALAFDTVEGRLVEGRLVEVTSSQGMWPAGLHSGTRVRAIGRCIICSFTVLERLESPGL